MAKTDFKSVDDYIRAQPDEGQASTKKRPSARRKK
jgi:hypothetical protein